MWKSKVPLFSAIFAILTAGFWIGCGGLTGSAETLGSDEPTCPGNNACENGTVLCVMTSGEVVKASHELKYMVDNGCQTPNCYGKPEGGGKVEALLRANCRQRRDLQLPWNRR